PAGDPQQQETFVPRVYLDDQWAVMHVDGWEKDAIKVFYGSSKTALKKGAGTWSGSRLCGQDGRKPCARSENAPERMSAEKGRPPDGKAPRRAASVALAAGIR
ncbi:MAG: hypothetical protein IJS87_04170, partial [Rhodocyclaceae bacterium]|nr:hypothetical protein [Rhodocyclaceae bacterium]